MQNTINMIGFATTYIYSFLQLDYPFAMHNMIKQNIRFMRLLYSIVLIFFAGSIHAMNRLDQYDYYVRPIHHKGYTWQPAVLLEAGLGPATAYGCSGTSSNALQLWQPKQDAVAMLLGFPVSSCVGQKILGLQESELDIINRMGKTTFCGHLHLNAAGSLGLFYHFCSNWLVALYAPFFSMRLSDVFIKGEDPTLTDADVNEFKSIVWQLGNLSLNDWHRSGMGDTTFLVGWYNDFPQNKQFLKNVYINWRVGLEFPTGRRSDEHKLMAISYGEDGAWAVPFGLGMELTFGTSFKAGFDAQLKHTFDHTHARRIKTDKLQSDLLLLQTLAVHKDSGLTQRFDLYVEWYRMIKGLSCTFGYEFLKHGDDVIALETNTFSSEIANTARSLHESTGHQMILTFVYDFSVHPRLIQWGLPTVELFARLPFNGHYAVLSKTIGLGLSLEF